MLELVKLGGSASAMVTERRLAFAWEENEAQGFGERLRKRAFSDDSRLLS